MFVYVPLSNVLARFCSKQCIHQDPICCFTYLHKRNLEACRSRPGSCQHFFLADTSEQPTLFKLTCTWAGLPRCLYRALRHIYQAACRKSDLSSQRHQLSWEKDEENKESQSSPPGTELKGVTSRYHSFQGLTALKELMDYFMPSDRFPYRTNNEVLMSYSNPVKRQNLGNRISKSVWKAVQNVSLGCVLPTASHEKKIWMGGIGRCFRMTGEHFPINLLDW